MAIANFSFGPKRTDSILLLIIVLVLTACQSSPIHEVHTSKRETAPIGTAPTRPAETPHEDIPPTVPAPQSPAPMQMGVAPKIGLILGPGALRAYAHVGVVQEFAKQKMPIHAIAGIEMGALVAAIYANKGQPYDVEWQMMKLKEGDLIQKGLLSNQVKAGDVRTLREFTNIALSSNRAENAKVPFVCPALQMDKQQVYLMNKGTFVDLLPFCLSFPPLFRPHQQNVAGVLSLKALVDYLRAKGANHIIYVDVLSGAPKINNADMETQILWSLAAESLSHQEKGLDYVLHVPLKDVDLLDFNRRREVIQKGQQAAVEASSQILKNVNW